MTKSVAAVSAESKNFACARRAEVSSIGTRVVPEVEVVSVALKLVLALLWVVAFGGFLVLVAGVVLFMMGMDPTR